MELKKVGEYKIRQEVLKTHPTVVCGHCGSETKLKVKYQDVGTSVDPEEMDILWVHFEEVDRSECCGDLVHLVNNNDQAVFGDKAYEYKSMKD